MGNIFFFPSTPTPNLKTTYNSDSISRKKKKIFFRVEVHSTPTPFQEKKNFLESKYLRLRVLYKKNFSLKFVRF